MNDKNAILFIHLKQLSVIQSNIMFMGYDSNPCKEVDFHQVEYTHSVANFPPSSTTYWAIIYFSGVA